MLRGFLLLLIIAAWLVVGMLAGCASRPVIQTQVLEKPVPIYCQVKLPKECKDVYAVDKVSPRDDPLVINRAMRIELEQRAVCQIKLEAALKGCNKQ